MLNLYRILSVLISPFLIVFFYIRCLRGKDRISSVKNHFGVPTINRPHGKLIWVHAASVGESTAALTFINHIKKKYPDLNILLSTITITSADILCSKIEKISNCYHQFAVADNPFWVKRFLNYWKVDVAVFLESEIWPNTIDILYSRKIPIFLLNARFSTKSFKRWSHFKGFISKTLKKFDCILAQSLIDEERYASFSAENTLRIDNLKYANAVLPCNDDLLNKLIKICGGKKVFVAASTHENEEEIILNAHEHMKKEFDVFTVIIPRHTVRVKKVCDLVQSRGLPFFLRSKVFEYKEIPPSEICIVDTFGEVGTFFRLADVCFVGGSLMPIGGHNIYEPVALGKPVLYGPFMDNALEVRDFLTRNGVAFEVKDEKDISKICVDLFENKEHLSEIYNKSISITNNRSLEQIDTIMDFDRFFA